MLHNIIAICNINYFVLAVIKLISAIYNVVILSLVNGSLLALILVHFVASKLYF